MIAPEDRSLILEELARFGKETNIVLDLIFGPKLWIRWLHNRPLRTTDSQITLYIAPRGSCSQLIACPATLRPSLEAWVLELEERLHETHVTKAVRDSLPLLTRTLQFQRNGSSS